ncbi:hypothetical protein D7252_02270 [Microbacterium sp. CGR2]|nr:hypothetical protein D7252_02270 [Microbacterium sp. CGR2]
MVIAVLDETNRRASSRTHSLQEARRRQALSDRTRHYATQRRRATRDRIRIAFAAALRRAARAIEPAAPCACPSPAQVT